MLKKWGALILVILLAAASAGSAELIQITLEKAFTGKPEEPDSGRA